MLALAIAAPLSVVLSPPVERIAVAGRSLSLKQEAMATIDSGQKIWDSGRALSRLIEEDSSIEGSRVLELGSGTGIGGLTAAACGAQAVLTDRPSMIPLLEVCAPHTPSLPAPGGALGLIGAAARTRSRPQRPRATV